MFLHSGCGADHPQVGVKRSGGHDIVILSRGPAARPCLFTFCTQLQLRMLSRNRLIAHDRTPGPDRGGQPSRNFSNVGFADGQVGHHGVLVGGDPLHLVRLGIGVEPGVDIVHEKF